MADIFDRMLDGINKGVNTISANSKTMMEKSRINNIIGGLENEKNNIIAQIGFKVRELYKEGKFEGFEMIESLCALVDEKEAQIAEQQKELEKLNTPAPPPYQPPYQQQPYQQPYQQPEQPQSTAAAFCPNCGTQITGGAVFCPNCGTRIG